MTKEIKETNKIKDLMSSSMNDLSDMTDVNAVVGKPIYTPDGTTVIPICKVTMGFMTGGGEYGEVRQLKNDKESDKIYGTISVARVVIFVAMLV